MKILITLLLSLNICFAQQISPIKEGETAKHTGYLVDKKFAEVATYNDKKIPLQEAKIDLLTRLGKIDKERAEDYKKRANKAELRGDLKGIGGFLLGVLASSLAVFAIKKAGE